MIYKEFINSLLSQGEFEYVNKLLNDLSNSIKSIQQFIFISEMNGYSLWFQNKFKESVDYLEKSISKIKEKGENIPSDLYYDLALANRDSGMIKKALDFYLAKTPLDKIEDWNPDEGGDISSDVGNISRCFYLQGKYENSLELCKKSVAYLKKQNTRHERINYGYGLLWLSDTYIKLGENLEAIMCINKAISIWERFCPSRLKKIINHIAEYPIEVIEKINFNKENCNINITKNILPSLEISKSN